MALLDDRAVKALTDQHARECGALVRERRKLLRLSQEQVADLSGITQPAISHIELGLKSPRDHVKVTIAAALSCSVADLWPHPDRERIALMLREIAA